MQTGAWMKYSDSAHFSDQNAYKTLFILIYCLRYEFGKIYKYPAIFENKIKGVVTFSPKRD
jgi:hypothetical protein